MIEVGRPPELAIAAFNLAFGVTGDEGSALVSLRSVAGRPPEPAHAFLRAVRGEARRHRPVAPAPSTAPRPLGLDHIAPLDWAMLERVAFRGMSAGEAADAIGIERPEALRRLRDGLIAHRHHLRELDRQERGDAESPDGKVLRADLAVHGLDDPARDRQPEPAPAGGVQI
jgi:hypothetical protein